MEEKFWKKFKVLLDRSIELLKFEFHALGGPESRDLCNLESVGTTGFQQKASFPEKGANEKL